MFKKGDIVERITTPLEGGIQKGTLAIVKAIIDDTYMTLEGHNGHFRQGCFVLHDGLKESRQMRQVSDLASVVNALRVIDNWNRGHTTSMMIGVEPYPSQDGGQVITINNEGFNDPDEFYAYVAQYSSEKDRKLALKHALRMIQAEVEDDD